MLEAVCGREPAISGLEAKDALEDRAEAPPRVADPGRDAAVCGRERGAAVGASDTPPPPSLLLQALMVGAVGRVTVVGVRLKEWVRGVGMGSPYR